MSEVVLYTKDGCCLCDDARRVIAEARAQVPFEYREVDITSDPALFAALRTDIPVITVDGSKAFKYRLTAQALIARLQR